MMMLDYKGKSRGQKSEKKSDYVNTPKESIKKRFPFQEVYIKYIGGGPGDHRPKYFMVR